MPDPTPAAGMCITGEDVRDHLLGVMPLIEAVATPVQVERILQNAINAAECDFERDLQYSIRKRVVKMYPDPGAEFDLEEDPLDYRVGEIDKHTLPTWVMRRRPIISVERARLAFSNRTGVLNIPVTDGTPGNTGWLKIQHQMGRVSVVPVGVPSSLSAGFAMWFSPLMEQQGQWKVIPQFVAVDYTCGMEDPTTDENFATSRWHIALDAATRVLTQNQRLIVTQTSQEGFSQSFQPVTKTIEDNQKTLADFYAKLRRQISPPQVRVI